MLKYKDIKPYLKGNYAQLFGMVLLYFVIASFGSIFVFNGSQGSSFLVMIHLFLSIVLLVLFRNYIFIKFLSIVRHEKVDRNKIKKTLLVVLISNFIIQLFLDGVILLSTQLFYRVFFIVQIIQLLCNMFILAVNMFIAFYIYDGDHTITSLIADSFSFVKREIKRIFIYSIPYLLWLVIYQLALNLLLRYGFQITPDFNSQISTEIQSSLAISLLFFNLCNIFVSSLICTRLYMYYALWYNKEKNK